MNGLFNTPAVTGNPIFATPQISPADPSLANAPKVPGVNPMNLISMAGMVAGALAPKGSWQSNLGNVATQQAQTQLLADAQLKRDNDYRKFLTEALKFHTPAEIGALANQQVGNQGYFNPANGVGNPYVEPPKGSNGGQ